jgi:transcriptional regulator CtsR
MFLVEAASTSVGNPLLDALLNYGVLGIVCILFAIRFIVPSKVMSDYKREQGASMDLVKVQYEERIRSLETRCQALEVVNSTLNQKYQDEMVPALIHANDMTRQTTDLIRALASRQPL